ncbi:1-acyl-sn-glycerol-3-phosphate acyltransferase [Endozoicomonas sp. SM1973]|uniref:1-acyl-sn-glycerol-3-phosphate acyltransferase n=1 Tax=Spartinivicinus marinus TaxID=2994442 RepID=A0A853I5D5_9GAMM|nr:lysophospholipid acyltransferase family protein [Spartinivicinus marinus]MCX4025417.1 lysophospholipid acyltransferase family protein [Spartinivicinus marinus]NYZ65354.1 1-acyl-sn-glycerol-3-phosphate acyltransferase [Spartinivicinus marinus]
MKKLYLIWRVLATGFSFLLFGLGGFLLALLAFPLINLVWRDQWQRRYRAQRLISCSFRFYLKVLDYLGVMSYEIKGLENLRADKGRVIIANHPSLLDVVLLIAALPQADCVVKQALWHNPLLKGVVKAAGYISNQDPETLINQCRASLNQGGCLILFPEGTRTTPGKAIRFQRGAANIALRAEADIRLVDISCQPTTLTKQEKWYQVADRKVKFLVEVKHLVEIKPFLAEVNELPRATRQLTRYLESQYT